MSKNRKKFHNRKTSQYFIYNSHHSHHTVTTQSPHSHHTIGSHHTVTTQSPHSRHSHQTVTTQSPQSPHNHHTVATVTTQSPQSPHKNLLLPQLLLFYYFFYLPYTHLRLFINNPPLLPPPLPPLPSCYFLSIYLSIFPNSSSLPSFSPLGHYYQIPFQHFPPPSPPSLPFSFPTTPPFGDQSSPLPLCFPLPSPLPTLCQHSPHHHYSPLYLNSPNAS